MINNTNTLLIFLNLFIFKIKNNEFLECILFHNYPHSCSTYSSSFFYFPFPAFFYACYFF